MSEGLLILGPGEFTRQCETLAKAMGVPAVASQCEIDPDDRSHLTDLFFLFESAKKPEINRIWVTELGAKGYQDYFRRLAFFQTLKHYVCERTYTIKLTLLAPIPDEFRPEAERIFDQICSVPETRFQDAFRLLLDFPQITNLRKTSEKTPKVLIVGDSCLTEQIRAIVKAIGDNAAFHYGNLNSQDDITAVKTICQVEGIAEVWITTLGIPEKKKAADIFDVLFADEIEESWNQSSVTEPPTYPERLAFFRRLKNYLADWLDCPQKIKLMLFQKIPKELTPKVLEIFDMIFAEEQLQIAFSLLAGFQRPEKIIS